MIPVNCRPWLAHLPSPGSQGNPQGNQQQQNPFQGASAAGESFSGASTAGKSLSGASTTISAGKPAAGDVPNTGVNGVAGQGASNDVSGTGTSSIASSSTSQRRWH